MSTVERPGPTARVEVVEHVGDEGRRREDRVVAEEPLELRLAWPGTPAHRSWVTMRSPGHDFELAAGWVLHEGLTGRHGVSSVAYCTDEDLTPQQEFNVVTVTLAAAPARAPGTRHAGHTTGSSACGVCGKDSIEEALAVFRGTPYAGPALEPDVVRSLPDLLRLHQRTFESTGGAHAAGLVDGSGSMLVVREDVGRHNAVDKVTGARLLAGLDPGAAALVVSGRAGFELVQKAVAAGVGALVAVGAPTSLSVSLATQSGLALYGFTGRSRTVRYA
ncbi:formate dehydrogenase accessory sulfurtransferase FdhD [Nocardioides aestuarii]|uniref:Formate dehydrogenase accessory sulfurtransferase FdhD n=1 Tax=Nocardioides aestuarii TaxID=252231 RepID=A0ABW4TSF4_9ACTN